MHFYILHDETEAVVCTALHLGFEEIKISSSRHPHCSTLHVLCNGEAIFGDLIVELAQYALAVGVNSVSLLRMRRGPYCKSH